MTCFAPPTHRGVFCYDGYRKFEAVCEKDGLRPTPAHTRDLTSTILEYISWVDEGPVYTKKGTLAVRQPPKHKDQPASYYRAQLVHYGLKEVKTRDPAKKALLRAIEAAPNRTLVVPPHILTIERELKVEWEEANRAAEQEYQDKKVRASEAKAVAHRQRVADTKERVSKVLQAEKDTQRGKVRALHVYVHNAPVILLCLT